MNLRKKFSKDRLKTLPPPPQNKQSEVRYRDDLLLLIQGLKRNLQEKIREFMIANPNATDAEILNYITHIIDRLRKAEILTFAGFVASRVANIINARNKEFIFNSLNTPSKNNENLEPLLQNEAVKNKIDEYIAKNVSLISSIKSDFLSDVEKAIRDNYLQNGHIKNLASIIKEKTNVTKSRARLIARDQTAKLTADLSKERHESLGINIYIWKTNLDERARKTHIDMNGILCRYDDDSVFSVDNGKTWQKRRSDMPKGKPGDEIQCRCRAQAVIRID